MRSRRVRNFNIGSLNRICSFLSPVLEVLQEKIPAHRYIWSSQRHSTAVKIPLKNSTLNFSNNKFISGVGSRSSQSRCTIFSTDCILHSSMCCMLSSFVLEDFFSAFMAIQRSLHYWIQRMCCRHDLCVMFASRAKIFSLPSLCGLWIERNCLINSSKCFQCSPLAFIFNGVARKIIQYGKATQC